MNGSQQSYTATSSDLACACDSYDEEYRFGRRPQTLAPFPFTTHEFARLLVLRSRIQADLVGADDHAPTSPTDVADSSARTGAS
jgi:hypothetical protein